MSSTKQLPILGALALALTALPASAQTTSNARMQPWPPEVIELAEVIPVQDGGRVKPLHTYAAFTLLRLNGKRSVKTPHDERLTPVEWLLDTLYFPEAAATYPVFIVQNAEVMEAIGISLEGKKRRDRYSLNEVRPGISKLFELAREYGAIEEKSRTSVQQQVFVLASNVNTFLQLTAHMDFARTPIEIPLSPELDEIFGGATEVAFSDVVAHMRELAVARETLLQEGSEAEARPLSEVLMAASELTSGTESLALIPASVEEGENASWHSPADLFFDAFNHGGTDHENTHILAGFESLAASRNDPQAFQTALQAQHDRLVHLAVVRGDYDKVPLEVTYYKAKLISYSQYLFVLSFLLMAFMWLRPRSRFLHAATSLAVLVPTLMLCGAIVMRCVIRGRPPVSTLYETVLFVVAVGALVALFTEAVNRKKLAISAAAILGTIGLFIANGYEMMDKRDTMPSLVAVLDTNFWLATHVTSITIGYSSGMLAALLASIYILVRATGLKKNDKPFFKSLSKMIYGVLCFSVIFSVVGTILGGIWANDSWGRFWGWDPKENGALLIVLSQLIILHARMGGYLRDHGVAMAVAFGGTVIAFSWWGVNLLGVGLHSYGFTSGIARALWIYYGIQWGIVGIGMLNWFLTRGSGPPKVSAEQRSEAGDRLEGSRA